MANSANIWLINDFTGGISDETGRGIRGSFAYGEQLDFRTNTNQLTGVCIPAKNTTTVIDAPVKWIAQLGTTVYAYGTNQKIFKSGSPWTVANTNAKTGVANGMAAMGTKLYYAADGFLGIFDGNVTWDDDFQAFTDTTANDWRPMKVFGPAGGLCIGDGRYIAVMDYDNVTYAATQLTLPLDTKVKCLEVYNDYLVIGTYKGASINDDNISTIYFWDGTSPTYNYQIDLNESGIHALLATSNGLLIQAGIRGNLYLYNGGMPVLIKRIPTYIKNGTTYNEIYPGAVTNYNGMALIGGPGSRTDTTSVTGIWSWGTINKNYPNVLNLDYLMSTGTKTATTANITAVQAINDTKLYFAWKDNTTYGIDLVGTTTPVTTCTYESLSFDAGKAFTQKNFKSFFLNFGKMATGETITLKYRKDTETSWTTIGVISSTGEDFYEFDYGMKCRSLQVQIILSGTNSTLPKLASFGALYTEDELD